MDISVVVVGEIQTNCYLIASDSGNAWIIDPGANETAIYTELVRKKWTPYSILLTHGHYDHIEAVTQLQQRFSIPVYIHPADGDMLNGELWQYYLGRPFPTISDVTWLQEGKILKNDELSLTVMCTPGHSPGSVSFCLDHHIFTGDTLFANGDIGRTDLWKGSPVDLLNSIKKLFVLPDADQIYPGHGQSSTIGREKKIHKR